MTRDRKLLIYIMINQKLDLKGKELKISTPKQMIQGLPIALAQVKAGNNS